MATLTPPPAAPQRGDRATFAQRMDAFITWLINFVGELLSLVANLNSLAAGGAYSIPYAATSPGSIGGAGGGKFALDGGTGSESTATVLMLDSISAAGVSVAILLDSMVAGVTSAVKGSIRLTKQNDPTAFLVFNILSFSGTGAYRTLSVQCINFSGPNPFANGDPIMLSFQRNGDKGDTGTAASPMLPTLYVRHEVSQGTDGQALTAGSNKRSLNAVKTNTIPGATLSNGQAYIPTAGYYNIYARATGYNVNSHRISLWTMPDNSLFEVGSSEFALDSGVANKSYLEVRNVYLSGPRTFELRHFVTGNNATNGGGRATNLNYSEIYAELIFEKVG
jgi:hypothetical protein